MQKHDCSDLPSLAVRFPGPFSHHDVVVNDWKVPFLKAHVAQEDRITLVLGERLALELSSAEADRIVPFLADAVSVALGYPAHPSGRPDMNGPPLPEPVRTRMVDAPDWTTWSMADQVVAADINRSVAGRTDAEYFHRPDAKPPFVAPPWTPTDGCNPISPKLHDGYWREAAVQSQRRRRADKLVLMAIERDVSDQIETVVVKAPAA